MRRSSRRELVGALGSAAIAWPVSALAQDHPQTPPLIGFLAGATLPSERSGMFLQGLKELGYVEGRDFQITYRSSEGYQDRLPALAEELVRLKPAVMIGAGLDAVVALWKVTQTIPIVSPTLADAVHLGLIATEGRPGGNVTGIEPYVAGLPAKQMELAREIVPGANRVGLLTNLSDPKAPPQAGELEAAGHGLEINITSSDANRPEEIESALQVLASRHVDVVIVLQTSMLLDNTRQIAAWALAKRLPTIYGYREHVVAGGLASYGVDLRWCYHRAASFVDKILHGARPGDLPVEFPTNMLLAINLKTAKALGLTVPSSLLVRADEVIE
jgi:putative tryptophan/tyrosine transport system substrate-binding protein